MFEDVDLSDRGTLREAIRQAYLGDDETLLRDLLPDARLSDEAAGRARDYARHLIESIRAAQRGQSGVDALLQEYALSSDEGVVLMCLAEALLRVPDDLTADRLIADKLAAGNWSSHLQHSHSWFINASAWGLLFTGKLTRYNQQHAGQLHSVFGALVSRLGAPVIREAACFAMRYMGEAFVLGKTIESAVARAEVYSAQGYHFSFDMLGEGARCAADAERYFQRYVDAIGVAGQSMPQTAGISVKLSALCPRYEFAQRDQVLQVLAPRLLALARQARSLDLDLTVDAEEAARLDLSLDVFERVYRDAALRGWDGFGLAVQAYQKRAPAVIAWLQSLARDQRRRIKVRLVKGAYWDTEIKRAQVLGLADYPVFSRKCATDVAFLACAKRLLDARPGLFPQFATHNAHSVASLMEMVAVPTGFEFQRLYGMGDELYQQLMADAAVNCRIYAPVGEHADLLAYLVRRLLENGANSSFVNQVIDRRVPLARLLDNPVASLEQTSRWRHRSIFLPREIYRDVPWGRRPNASGLCWSDICGLRELRKPSQSFERSQSKPRPASIVSLNPACVDDIVGYVTCDSEEAMRTKVGAALAAYALWCQTSPASRANLLRNMALALEKSRSELIALCVREAGKTLPDSLAEVREAIDFCYFYAAQIERQDTSLRSPLGVVLCISPWNFPLAIFIGQIAAALAAGNTVVAKPAEQTSLIAQRAVELFRSSGMPNGVVQLVVAAGDDAGKVLLPDERISAVTFTGSVDTAQKINRILANRSDAPIVFITETGGVNAMIVDSTALPEQVVDDVIRSGFHSAGQRCSALRVLFLQEECADPILAMLQGAMAELRVGDPGKLSTDIGPVIDRSSKDRLEAHCQSLSGHARLLYRTELDAECHRGYFFAPALYEIDSLARLQEETFGPVIHVIRYRADSLEAVINQINTSGYGLTLGIHSRVQTTADWIARTAQVGNIYINRDMVGAVVGVQPFGGRGKSGTGPKVGGPNTLKPLQARRTPRPGGVTIIDDSRIDAIFAIAPEIDRQRLESIMSTFESDYAKALSLPGPTGETNTLHYEPRGLLLGVYAQDDPWVDCVVAVLSTLLMGNRIALRCPRGWRCPLERIAALFDRPIEWDESCEDLGQWRSDTLEGALAGVFVSPDSGLRSTLARQLARRPGPIVPLICDVEGDALYRYATEKVVTINTTASGGNAALMMLSDE